MNVTSILKEKLIGTTMKLFLDNDGQWYKYDTGNGRWKESTIVNVVYVDSVIDSSDVFQSDAYYILVFDSGYEMELYLN